MEMAKISLKGVIDLHVHSNPDLRHRAYADKAEHILQLWDNFTVPDHLDAAVRSMDHFDHVIPGGCCGQPDDFAAEFETALYR